jgi:phage N-6-adenine-methyltransferase
MGVVGRPRTYDPARVATNAERQARYQQQLKKHKKRYANRAILASLCQDWETDPVLFAQLNDEFHFNIDACAEDHTKKCAVYYTIRDNALLQDWQGVVWMNAPYGKEIGQWMAKAYASAQAGATVVCLVASRTGTKWWQDLVIKTGAEVRFLPGRQKFRNAKYPGLVQSATFNSALVIYHPQQGGSQ